MHVDLTDSMFLAASTIHFRLRSLAWLLGVLAFLNGSFAEEFPSVSVDEEPPPVVDPEPAQAFLILEFRVVGSKTLPTASVDKALYSHLGPGRTPEDVESARAALEKAYHEEGYQTVSVSVPPQGINTGVIVLQVTEATVGRLRVKGSRFFDIEKIKKMAPALAEGTVPNFNEVQRDIIARSQTADL